ncbi:hypothetical protein MRX96_034014 [Rhipicephalus microplus]
MCTAKTSVLEDIVVAQPPSPQSGRDGFCSFIVGELDSVPFDAESNDGWSIQFQGSICVPPAKPRQAERQSDLGSGRMMVHAPLAPRCIPSAQEAATRGRKRR